MKFLLALVLLVFCSTVVDADTAGLSVCLAPLNANLKTFSWIKTDANNNVDLKSSFCSTTFETTYRHNTEGLSVTVPVYDVPLTFGGSNDNENNWEKRTHFCSDSSAHFSSASSQSIYLEYANEGQFKAYIDCIKILSDKIPVTLSADSENGLVVIKADYQVIGSSLPYATVKSFQSVGLDCGKNAFRRGDHIIAGGTSYTCARDQSNSAAVVVLNTNEGSREIVIPRLLDGTPAGEVVFLTTQPVTHEVPIAKVSYWFNLDGLNHDTRAYRFQVTPSSPAWSRPAWSTSDPTAHYIEDSLTYPTGFSGNVGKSSCEEHEDTAGGYGCPYVFTFNVTFNNGDTVAYIDTSNGGRRVGVGTMLTVAIYQTAQETNSSPPTTMSYGHSFVVPVPVGTSVSLKVHSLDFGDYITPLQDGTLNDPNGLLRIDTSSGAQVQGSTTYYTVKVIDPNSDEFSALR
jgi:hypothetical protein